MKKYILLFLIIFLAIMLRLIPYFSLREPLSTDVWPLIREGNLLIRGVKIWNNTALGGYNNRIPGLLLFSQVVSISTGISPYYIFSFFSSLVILETMLLFYILVEKLGGNGLIAISFSFFIGSFMIFTSSLLKEVYAYPIFLLILFLSYFARSPKDLIPIFISIPSLVIIHPLPTVFIIGIAFLIPLIKRGVKYVSHIKYDYKNDLYLIITGIFAMATFLIYYYSYGMSGVKGYLVNSFTFTFFIYLFLITVSYIMFSPKNRNLPLFFYILSLFFGIFLLFLSSGNTTFLYEKDYYWQIILIGFPIIFLVPSGFKFEFNKTKDHLIASSLFILFASSILYIMLSSPLLQFIAVRLTNYLIMWGGIVLGIITKNKKIRKYGIIISAISLLTGGLTISILSSNLIYETHWFVSSNWRYSYGFAQSALTAYKLNGLNLTFYGDTKVSYFFSNMININTNQPILGNLNGLLLLYRANYYLGYYMQTGIVNLSNLPINYNNLVLISPYLHVYFYR
ncbi:MAG: hypothetical protein ACP5M8_06900 [Caldisphaera sp.]